ncbi:MAG TPA: ankyrin repeat domain-containing protein [Candidatus Acidoferrales bacterium]|nr:ankyrin repeat domain-containing protein [Candidatus Acidoferrales bacterium]
MESAEFIAALKRGDIEAARIAAKKDPSLAGSRDAADVSVVCLAVYAGQLELAGELASVRDDLDIFEASCIGDHARLKELLAREPSLVNARSPDGFQPIGYACFFGRPEIFETLVAVGAEIDSPSNNAMQVRPIHSAVAQRDARMALSLTRRLLDLGASPNVRQQRGFTPLHEAALRGDT